jgi:1-acyl-sn-glycerol-3-phosphate acyltransferase
MSRAPSILRAILGFLLVAVSAIAWMAVAVVLFPFRVLRIKMGNFYGKTVGYGVARMAGATPVVTHRERLDDSFPAIYVANHTSTLDAFLSIWLCPVGGCGVMKREILRIPFFGLLYLLSGHLYIDRSKRDKAIAALAGVAKYVRENGLGIWIMPEGTRSKTGRLQPFKVGFVHMAIATGLPVVPVVMHDAHHVWPLGPIRFAPGTVDIDVLEPISTEGWTAENAQQHADEVHDLMARALREDQRPVPVPAPTLAVAAE